MANLAPNGYNAALARLPNEICDAIFELLTSARDSVGMILAFEKHCSAWDTLAAWTKLYPKYKHNILPEAQFCELFEWDGNSTSTWIEMDFKPSDWTRLPTQFSYAEMMYCHDCYPACDLDGNEVSEERFLECFWEEQEQMRAERIIMQSYLTRTDQDHPSKGSRARLKLADRDTRSYKELLDQGSCLLRRKDIEARRMDDEKERSRQLRQPQAFRKVFCELALNKNFKPTACQGCLTDDVIPFEPHDNWQDDIKGWNMRQLRFCLDCAVEHANAIEYAASQSIAYVFAAINSPSKRGNSDFAAHVAKNIVKLHQLSIWSDVELGHDDDESFEFWSEAISWAKSRVSTEHIDASDIAHNDSTIAALAEKYWEEFISTRLQRVLKGSVVGKFHVTMSGLRFFDQEPQVNTLIRETIHHKQLYNLCIRIHGKTPEQVLLDDTDVSKRRLDNYEVYMLAFIRLTGMIPVHLLELIIDLVVCVTPDLLYNSSDADALGSFFTYFLMVVKDELSFMSPWEEVSVREYFEACPNLIGDISEAFLRHLYNNILHVKVYDWASKRRVSILLPYGFTEDETLDSTLFLRDILRLFPCNVPVFFGNGRISGYPVQYGRVFSQPILIALAPIRLRRLAHATAHQ